MPAVKHHIQNEIPSKFRARSRLVVSQLPAILTPGDVEALIECFRLKRVVSTGCTKIFGESLDPTRRLELRFKRPNGDKKGYGVIIPTEDWRKEAAAKSANVDMVGGCGMSAGADTYGRLERGAIIRRAPGGTVLYRMKSDFPTSATVTATEGTFESETDTNETGASAPGNNTVVNKEVQVMDERWFARNDREDCLAIEKLAAKVRVEPARLRDLFRRRMVLEFGDPHTLLEFSMWVTETPDEKRYADIFILRGTRNGGLTRKMSDCSQTFVHAGSLSKVPGDRFDDDMQWLTVAGRGASKRAPRVHRIEDLSDQDGMDYTVLAKRKTGWRLVAVCEKQMQLVVEWILQDCEVRDLTDRMGPMSSLHALGEASMLSLPERPKRNWDEDAFAAATGTAEEFGFAAYYDFGAAEKKVLNITSRASRQPETSTTASVENGRTMGEKHHQAPERHCQAPSGREPTPNSAAKGVDDNVPDECSEHADVAPSVLLDFAAMLKRVSRTSSVTEKDADMMKALHTRNDMVAKLTQCADSGIRRGRCGRGSSQESTPVSLREHKMVESNLVSSKSRTQQRSKSDDVRVRRIAGIIQASCPDQVAYVMQTLHIRDPAPSWISIRVCSGFETWFTHNGAGILGMLNDLQFAKFPSRGSGGLMIKEVHPSDVPPPMIHSQYAADFVAMLWASGWDLCGAPTNLRRISTRKLVPRRINKNYWRMRQACQCDLNLLRFRRSRMTEEADNSSAPGVRKNSRRLVLALPSGNFAVRCLNNSSGELYQLCTAFAPEFNTSHTALDRAGTHVTLPCTVIGRGVEAIRRAFDPLGGASRAMDATAAMGEILLRIMPSLGPSDWKDCEVIVAFTGTPFLWDWKQNKVYSFNPKESVESVYVWARGYSVEGAYVITKPQEKA